MSEPNQPTVNQVLAGWLQNAVSHPRSTISGFLSIFLIIGPTLISCGCIPVKWGLWLTGATTLAKALWAAFAMQDPGKTLALVPGNPMPQNVPSHEVPNDPAAKVVPGPKS